MYKKCGKIHKSQKHEHNYVRIHLKNNAIRVTHMDIKLLQECFCQLTTFELIFDIFLKYSISSCTQFYT